ncbi:hypothetical protein AB0C38_10510 [Amycolatopsis sp. NPDC048633]|uniref:hypothetical protein n=1 Tax=Amycolatopsis sp. NPDC048633 TaxID=3157095 RepID=UPI0033EFFFDA
MSVEVGSIPLDAGSTAIERCRHYSTVCGLPARVVHGSRIVVRLDGLVGAVTMPADLAHRVAVALRLQSLPAPAVAHPGGKRWTFLTGPGSVGPDNARNLLPIGVNVVGDEASVVLPSPETELLGLWRWTDRSVPLELPAQAVLLASARALSFSATGGRSGW